jgi:hypothetical protein
MRRGKTQAEFTLVHSLVPGAFMSVWDRGGKRFDLGRIGKQMSEWKGRKSLMAWNATDREPGE